MVATWWTPKKKQGTEANQKSARFSRTLTLRESIERIRMLMGMQSDDGAKQSCVVSGPDVSWDTILGWRR
eukprot:2055972-Rhodomonas_salina.1